MTIALVLQCKKPWDSPGTDYCNSLLTGAPSCTRHTVCSNMLYS